MPLLPAPAKLSHAKLSHAEKDTLIAALTARLDEVTRPPKTPGPDRPPRKSRPGVGISAWAGRCIRTPTGRSTGG